MRAAIALSSLLIASGIGGCGGCSKSEGGADASPQATAKGDAAPVNATPVPTASVAAMVNPENLPAYTGPTGSVEGTITVTGDPAPERRSDFKRCPDAVNTYGRAFREGPPQGPDGARPLADAIVAVTGYSGFFIPEKEEAKQLTIEGCGYAKRTVTMTFGQRLEVKNLSKEFWTPVLTPGPSGVMMMATPNGDPVKLYPKKPGRYRLSDRDRPYAEADVFVFLHPLHTTTDLKGYYRIDGVPVGKVTINTTHPRIPDSEASVEVDVQEGAVHRVDLRLEHKAPPPRDAGPVVDGGRKYLLH